MLWHSAVQNKRSVTVHAKRNMVAQSLPLLSYPKSGGLHLKLLTELELRSLASENQAWFPPAQRMVRNGAVAAIIDAIRQADSEDECRRRVAWLYCWLVAVRRRHVGSWLLFHIKTPGALQNYDAVFKLSASKLASSNCEVALEHVVVDGGVYACLLTKDRRYTSADMHEVYLVTWCDKPLLAICAPGSLRRRLNAALDAALPDVPVRMLPVCREHLGMALLEGLELIGDLPKQSVPRSLA